MRKTLFLIFAALLLSGITAVQAQEEVFADRFERIIEQYMNTKDGMVHNRTDLAAAWAERLETTLCTAPNHIFPDDELSFWTELRPTLVSATATIVDAGSIDEQREALAELSSGIKTFIDRFGNPGEPLYAFSCPHFGDGGVVWLNRNERVANPYHGPEMISCGEVIAQL
jgi:hypothetical protein